MEPFTEVLQSASSGSGIEIGVAAMVLSQHVSCAAAVLIMSKRRATVAHVNMDLLIFIAGTLGFPPLITG